MHQPIGMMNALGISGDLGADDTCSIALQLGAAYRPDVGTIDHLDIEGTRRRAIVRTGGMPDVDSCLLVHASIGSIKNRDRRAHLSAAPRRNPAACHASCAEIGSAVGVDGRSGYVARRRSTHEPHRRSDIFRLAPLPGDRSMAQAIPRF